MNKILLSIILVLIPLFFLYAQSEENNKKTLISIRAANSLESLLDQSFGLLKFQGTIKKVGLRFERQKTTDRFWNISIDGLLSDLEKPNIDYKKDFFPTNLTELQISAALAKSIYQKEHLNLSIGGQFNSLLMVLNFDDFGGGSWLSAQNLGIHGRLDWSISEKHRIQTNFTLPLLAWVSRPKYTGKDEYVIRNNDNIPNIIFTRGELKSIAGFFNPQLEVMYNYQLEKLDLFCALNYTYTFVKAAGNLYKNSTSLSLGLTYKINKQ